MQLLPFSIEYLYLIAHVKYPAARAASIEVWRQIVCTQCDAGFTLLLLHVCSMVATYIISCAVETIEAYGKK